MYNNKQINRSEVLEPMPEGLYQELVNLAYVQSYSRDEGRMTEYITKWLNERKYRYFVDRVGNIIVKKGRTKNAPAVVAHLDTVHQIVDDYTVYSREVENRKILFAKSGDLPTGIGGDDKCGILSALYALQNTKNINVIFFSREEIGMIGSSNISPKNISDAGYIIQLDRWGRGDFIDTYYREKTVSDDFSDNSKPVLEKYGFKSTEGLFTDSISLWDSGVGVSCVNVSCGYYQHHSKDEMIDTNELYNSILFMQELVDTLGSKRYESKPKPVVITPVKKKQEEKPKDKAENTSLFKGIDEDYVDDSDMTYDNVFNKKTYFPDDLGDEYIGALWGMYEVNILLRDEFVKMFYEALNDFNTMLEDDGFYRISPERFEAMILHHLIDFGYINK